MKKQKLEKQDILRLGDKVLNAVRLPEDEVDRIVASPDLFASIRSAIELEDLRGRKESGPVLHVLRWQTVVGTVSVFALFAIAIGFSDRIRREYPSEVARTAVTGVTPVDVSSPPTASSDFRERESHAIEPTAQKRRKAIVIQKTRRKSTKMPVPTEPEAFSQFYALTYAGDLHESEENGQLVRVDLPRESLFAMGITVPTENLADKIKTDLLIGEDGIVRAIRLVN